MGTLILSLDSVQPNILEYTISIQCGCIVHLVIYIVVSHAPGLPSSRSGAYGRASHDMNFNQPISSTIIFNVHQLELYMHFA